jgi:hypothetical protein
MLEVVVDINIVPHIIVSVYDDILVFVDKPVKIEWLDHVLYPFEDQEPVEGTGIEKAAEMTSAASLSI